MKPHVGLGALWSSFNKQYVLPPLDVKLCKTGTVPWLLIVWLFYRKNMWEHFWERMMRRIFSHFKHILLSFSIEKSNVSCYTQRSKQQKGENIWNPS